jgi:phage protein D
MQTAATDIENFKKRARDYNMIINLSKTKEIVFHRPNPLLSLYPDSLAYIDQVHGTTLLGIVLNHRLAFNS